MLKIRAFRTKIRSESFSLKGMTTMTETAKYIVVDFISAKSIPTILRHQKAIELRDKLNDARKSLGLEPIYKVMEQQEYEQWKRNRQSGK